MVKIEAISGGMNTDEATVLANVRASIRRQYPQVRPYQPQATPLALVAGGPSLSDTEDELRECVFRGCKVATVNNAYQWCIDRNIKPSMAIALDARPENADFFRTDVPGCQYLMASQCAPAMFDMLAGREVYLFHALSYDEPEKAVLDAYFGKERYAPVTGGSTVTIRALSLLRMLGFLRMDVFGFDSCWLDDRHHAYPQALNDTDGRMQVRLAQGDHERVFTCAPWHMKQLDDFQQLIAKRGNLFDLHIHGDGMIAHFMKTGATIVEHRKQREKEVACA